jgi:hypothetical protein
VYAVDDIPHPALRLVFSSVWIGQHCIGQTTFFIIHAGRQFARFDGVVSVYKSGDILRVGNIEINEMVRADQQPGCFGSLPVEDEHRIGDLLGCLDITEGNPGVPCLGEINLTVPMGHVHA